MKRETMVMTISAVLLLMLTPVFGSDTTDEAPISVLNAETAPPVGPVATYQPTDDLWDLLFSYNVSSSCGDSHMLGIEFAGDHFWVTGGNSGTDPNKIYKIRRDGTMEMMLDQPSIATGWGFRDLAWDGTYLYASPDNGVIYAFDLEGNFVPSYYINGPNNPNRALAYDPATDHFWTKSYDDDIYEFDRNGTVIYHGAVTEANAAYGMAWDDGDPAGPWIWIFDQSGPSTPEQKTTIVQYDPVSHVATGVSYLLPLVGSNVGQMAGGLTFTDEHTTGNYTLIGMTQGEPDDHIFVLEMYETGTPGDLEGVVSEFASSSPIEGAMVVLGDDTTYTNALGEYELLGVPIGMRVVTASAFGYNPETVSVEIFSSQATVQNFALTQPSISVDVSTIELTLYPGQTHYETFNIDNLGNGDLEFDIDIEFDPIAAPPTDNGNPNNNETWGYNGQLNILATNDGITWNGSTDSENQTNSTLAGPMTRTAPGYFETDQPWLECNPVTGTIQPGGSQNISASFHIPDTSTVGDIYDAEIIIHNNTASGDYIIDVVVSIVSSINITGNALPLDYALYQNYPNPFNPSTDIRFDLREHTHVTLAVYNILGQKVLTLVDKPLDAGTHLVNFNGALLASGVYFYTINAGSFIDMKKMILME